MSAEKTILNQPVEMLGQAIWTLSDSVMNPPPKVSLVLSTSGHLKGTLMILHLSLDSVVLFKGDVCALTESRCLVNEWPSETSEKKLPAAPGPRLGLWLPEISWELPMEKLSWRMGVRSNYCSCYCIIDD